MEKAQRPFVYERDIKTHGQTEIKRKVRRFEKEYIPTIPYILPHQNARKVL